eukprot:CAMPEP_0115675288 /NCGR_PEP_ID=MMETSP0272-20121206/54074_1 /TAXON_ID=71861 /ORGANISM="Scrippsiella trochoidea, Strain CCMP3099" /LENGTH=197 /DNA_ID=CAMNT_0003114253 /DNA_START=288 /DNA_END=882 /DNA_ORIENTATION=-
MSSNDFGESIQGIMSAVAFGVSVQGIMSAIAFGVSITFAAGARTSSPKPARASDAGSAAAASVAATAPAPAGGALEYRTTMIQPDRSPGGAHQLPVHTRQSVHGVAVASVAAVAAAAAALEALATTAACNESHGGSGQFHYFAWGSPPDDSADAANVVASAAGTAPALAFAALEAPATLSSNDGLPGGTHQLRDYVQ